MKYRLLAIFLILIACLSAQELSEMRVVGNAQRLGNEMVSHSITDANGEICAGVVIVSDLIGLTFDSYNGVVKVDQSKPGESTLYVSPGERVVQVYKTGFKPLKIMLYDSGIRTLESGQVWKIEITGTVKLDMIPIVINTDPEGASIFLDDENIGTGTTFKAVPGKHRLRVEMQGYATGEKEIEVDVDHILFDIKLQEISQQIVTIKSVPPGATIFLNNMQEGQTDKQLLRYPGIYDLRLMLEKYRTVEEKITISENGPNTFAYTLEKLAATLTVQVVPADAEIYLNSRKLDSNVVEISPGMHKLEVRHGSYESESRTITAPKGQDIIERFTLKAKQGRFIVVVEPMDASVTMLSGQKIVSSWTGSKEFDQILTGEYQLVVNKSGYKEQTLLVRIDEDQTKSMTVVLEKGESTPGTAAQEKPKTAPNIQIRGSEGNMVFVQGGKFMMGDEFGDGVNNERPVHELTIKSFYMGKFEVTQQEWESLMSSNPSSIKGPQLPVTNITFLEMLVFCNRLSEQHGLQPVYKMDTNKVTYDWRSRSVQRMEWEYDEFANGYRLPLEKEWEYAAKGGAMATHTKYSGSNNIDDVAWFSTNSQRKTHPGGEKQPNELGIYDMSGNAWEACYDWYDRAHYTRQSKAPDKYPQGPTRGNRRIRRGGGYSDKGNTCTVSYRHSFSPAKPSNVVGLRVVRNAE